MWKDFWFLVGVTLRTTLRKRSSLILYFGLPVAGVLLSILLYSSSGATPLRVGVVNGDAAEAIAADTVHFLQRLDKMELVQVSETQLRKKLAAGELDSGLIIGSGFSQSVLQGKPDHIVIQSVKGAQVTAYMKSMLNGYIDNVANIADVSAGDTAKFSQLYSSYRGAEFKLSAEQITDTSATKNITYQSIGFLILFMMTSAINLSELILKNRENRTYFRILSSPVDARTYVLSNIFVNLCIMLSQIVVTLFMMRTVFGLDPGIPFAEMLGIMGLFSLVSVSLSLVIVAFSKSSATAGALQNLIVTPTCLLSGCFFPIGIMPASIRRIADFLPQNWALQAITKLQSGSPLSAIGFNVAVLLAFAVVFFLIATYVFGRNNDTRNFV
jgi:ABC-2 type transport system permease protein